MKYLAFLGLFDRDPIVIGGPTGGGAAITTQDAGPELLDEFYADSTEVAGAATETTFDKALTLPAAKLKVGDIVEATVHILQTGRNATDTTQIKVHLDNASGPILYDSGALNATANLHLPLELKFVMTAEGASGAGRALGYIPFGATGGNGSFSYDTTAARKLVVTVTHSSNNAANKTLVKSGYVKLFRKPA
ncbi:MAG: hypothetical protein U1A78_41630 [Polyangia bacterium]